MFNDQLAKRLILMISNEKEKFAATMHEFFKNAKQETSETKIAYGYIQKHLRGEKLTDEENHAVKQQIGDIFKSVGIMVPFALIPGASVLIPIIMKLCVIFHVDFNAALPSSFQIHKDVQDHIDSVEIDNKEK